jgi:hypothetical protein
LFNRSKGASIGSTAPLQVPDELASKARTEYGNARFAAAAALYSEAVDKLHTMYVIGRCRYREPSSSDAPITEGLASSVGAALAMDSSVPVRSLIERSTNYLGEILEMPQAASVSSTYQSAIAELSRLYRTASN